MSETKPGSVALEGNELCSKEECGRPAVSGFRFVDGVGVYHCASHKEIELLYGQLDWLTGERDYTIGDWLNQVRATSAGAWDKTGDMKNFLFLSDPVSDDTHMPYKKQHEWTLQSLEAALDVACDLTQEKIDRLEADLRQKEA